MLFNRPVFPSLTSFRISSPNSVFCHANHERVNFAGFVLVEGLVHEASARIRRQKHLDTSFDLRVVRRREGLHHDAHRPDHVVTDMRSPDTFARRTPEEVGIRLAPNETTRISVDRVLHVHIAQVGHRKQARNVRVVHQKAVPVAVHLEGVDPAEVRVVVRGVFLKGRLHLVGKSPYIQRPVSSPCSPSSGFRKPCAAT